ncbi:E3 ubiquitin-protein ligase TRAIP-like [Hyposmocoma kahamanoa]|uniref:E3 ubiquitin-protein ligase TRAIP-like n=1 Tax=Hyposmocoma kahamanoa TaxID=1477025 RepID=UPI000E6D5F2B|nr:E3 ubiquitin-protein ligase TRAIP-like [Hyposmocoma kahamanoa]
MSAASVSCIICKEILISDVASGPCGHMFHNNCIKQWIQKSATCPQCRAKVTLGKVLKLYPTFTDEAMDDVGDLHMQLEDRTRKLKESEEKCESLSSQLVKTEATLEKTRQMMYENTIRDMRIEASLVAVTEQAKYLKEENKKVKKLQKENVLLSDKLTTLHGLQVVLDGTEKDVEEMTKTYTDIKMIATFAIALKRALTDTEKEKSQLMAKLKLLTQELQLEKGKGQLSARRSPDYDSLQDTHRSPLVKKSSPQKRNPKMKAKTAAHVEPNEYLKKRKITSYSSDMDGDSSDSVDSNIELYRQIRPRRVAQNSPYSPYVQVKQGWLGTIMNKNKKLAPKAKQNR